jgi:hypothetical protein
MVLIGIVIYVHYGIIKTKISFMSLLYFSVIDFFLLVALLVQDVLTCFNETIMFVSN